MEQDPLIQGVVTAVAVMVGPGVDHGVSQEARLNLAERIEKAMSQAVLDANADGIGHDQPDEIRARMWAARDRVVEDYNSSR